MLAIAAIRLINKPITIVDRNRRFSNEKLSLLAKIKFRISLTFFLIIHFLFSGS